MDKPQITEPQKEPSANSAEAAVPAQTNTKQIEKRRTFGNIVYDFGVFGSIAWVGVAALSAFSAHEAMHGNHPAFGWLRKLNDKVFTGLSGFLSRTFKNASKETIEGYAKGTTMFLTLGMGGNSLMAPIKWLEDNRQKNAARIDNLAGTIPPDPETIAHEPKQTWRSVISGRLMSWGLSYAAFLAMGPKIASSLSNWFGEKTATQWMRIRPESNPAMVRKWTDIVAFDALFTIITAGLTYAFSRSFARKYERNQNIEKQNEAPAPTSYVKPEEEEEKKSFAQSIEPRNAGNYKTHGSFRKKVESEPELSHSLS